MTRRDVRSGPGGRPPLDPAVDPGRWNEVVRSIVDAAGPELARRRAQEGLEQILVGWARPVLSAAASVALVAGAVTLLTLRSAAAGEAATPLVAEALLPTSMAAWLVVDHSPTITELVSAVTIGDVP